jgi:CheY-like chemotaxis protein
MPRLDGLEPTKRIRNIEAQMQSSPNVIIGVTANVRAKQIAVA